MVSQELPSRRTTALEPIRSFWSSAHASKESSASGKLLRSKKGVQGLEPSWPTSENFGDAPCLSDTTAWGVRGFGVEDLADGADPGFDEMRSKSCQKTSRCISLCWVDLSQASMNGPISQDHTVPW